MFPQQLFAPDATGVLVRLPAPVDHLLAALAAHDDATAEAAPPVPLAVVPAAEEDVFAQLEAEMVTDSLTRAAQARRDEAGETVRALLATAGPAGVEQTVPVEQAQHLLEWLNRRYVASRTAELSAAGVDATVGAGQSAAALLGLDDEDDPDPGETTFGMVPWLLASLVEQLQQVLLALPAQD